VTESLIIGCVVCIGHMWLPKELLAIYQGVLIVYVLQTSVASTAALRSACLALDMLFGQPAGTTLGRLGKGKDDSKANP
jgi:hypothetical protein